MRRRYINIGIILTLVLVFTVVSCKTPAGRTPTEVVDDGAITSEIKTKLLADRTVSGLDISVATFEGNVTLTGAVENEQQKSRAQEIARSAKGVKKVNNLLAIKKS